MRIPVFVSAPTTLSAEDEAIREALIGHLSILGLEPRALGRSDYPTENPLREVRALARRCAGGLLLGFGQFTAATGVMNNGTAKESRVDGVVMPSPWNQLEGGLMVGLQLPLLVFRDVGVRGGMFDPGVGEYFVQAMPKEATDAASEPVAEVMRKWAAKVQQFYFAN